jgi:hypothetical protein
MPMFRDNQSLPGRAAREPSSLDVQPGVKLRLRRVSAPIAV